MHELCDRQTRVVRRWIVIRRTLLVVWCFAVSLMTTELLAQEPDYFPLHVGDFWKYEETCFSVRYWTLEVTGLDTVKGREYYVIREDHPFYGYTGELRYRKDEQNQVWQYFEREDAEYLRYKLSAQVGESWDFGNIARVTLVEKHGEPACGTPFHQFARCLGFSFDYGGTTIYEFLADSVGMIKTLEEGCTQKLFGARVNGIEFGNPSSVHSIAEMNDSGLLPEAYSYPNPFRKMTTIVYYVPSTATVELRIYDSLGRLVRVFDHGTKRPGVHYAHWNGTSDGTSPVPSGAYFIVTKVNASRSVTRLLLAR